MLKLLLKSLSLVMALLCFIASPASVAADDKPIKLKLASVSAPSGQVLDSDGVQWWMDKVTERSKGRVTFETFWGSSLAAPIAHLDILQKGMVDIILGCRIYTPGKTPLGPYHYVIPFGPTDMRLVNKATRQIYEEIPAFREELAKQNAILIANFVTMPYDVISKAPVSSLAEMKGKKIGLIGQYFGRWAKAAGLVPVVAPMSERYNLLQSGVTEMDFHPITHMNAFKVQELARNYIKVEAMVGAPWDLLFNLEKFKSLPPDIQKIMLDAGKEAEIAMASELSGKWRDKILSAWKAQGVTFSEFPAEERAKWAALVEDIPSEWALEMEQKGLPGWQIMNRYQEITTELGYKWPRKWAVKK
jgi:TRAP-type C4-dicarboxylate transport system substrate-binding protein